MKKLLTLLFLSLEYGFAQDISNLDDFFCAELDHSGFLNVTEERYEKSFSFILDSSFTVLPFAVNVDGIVDTVYSKQTNVLNLNDKLTPVPITGISNHQQIIMKTIRIKNHKVIPASSEEANMDKVFKSNKVFVPASLELNPGDNISIKNYVALIYDDCNTGNQSGQKAMAYGEYSLGNQSVNIQAKKSSQPKSKHKKMRKANGKSTKTKNDFTIVY